MSFYKKPESAPFIIIFIFTLLILILVYLFRQTQWYTDEEIEDEILIEQPYV